MRGIPFSAFGLPYQYKEVETGKSAVAYLYNMPSDYVGFIYDLALNRYAKTYLVWEIDNEKVEQIERPIGEFTKPKLFDPPYFVQNLIRFTAYNNDSKARLFEVLCDGILVRKIP